MKQYINVKLAKIYHHTKYQPNKPSGLGLGMHQKQVENRGLLEDSKTLFWPKIEDSKTSSGSIVLYKLTSV